MKSADMRIASHLVYFVAGTSALYLALGPCWATCLMGSQSGWLLHSGAEQFFCSWPLW